MILSKVYDKLSKQMFLIDSGACGNFLPVSDDQAEEVESHFYDASGNPIKCFGNVTLDVDIGFGKMSDVFCICAIEQPILGFEFLRNHKITLDASTCFLKCEDSKKQVNTLQGQINSYDFFPAHEIKCTNLLQNILVFQLPKKLKQSAISSDQKALKVYAVLLALAQFYAPLIPNLFRKLVPLYDMIKGKRSSQSLLKWTPELVKSFEGAKDCLANYTALAFPAAHANISFVTDASNDAAGAVLQQEIDGVVQPLVFFSRIFSRIAQKYAAFDKELTAIVMALKHFCYFLALRNFTIYTDHKPIVAALNSESDRENARQARQLAYISEFTTDVRDLPGTSNIVADTLSL